MATIISRDHPKWQRAEEHAQRKHGASLEQLGLEGVVLATIERGEDPKRVVEVHQPVKEQAS